MLADGLFTRFPCDQIYGMHNRPGSPVGQFSITTGPAMAGGAFFDITITGKGAHGARPEASIDPVYAACQIGTALQSVVARNIPPFEMAVVSVTQDLRFYLLDEPYASAIKFLKSKQRTHVKDEEIARYIEAADQEFLADEALASLAHWEMSNPNAKLDTAQLKLL